MPDASSEHSLSSSDVDRAAAASRLLSVRGRQRVTSATRKLFRREIKQLREAVDESTSLAALSLARLLVCMAQFAIDQGTDEEDAPTTQREWEKLPPGLLRKALHKLGPLETARFIKRLKVSGLADDAIASLLAWKDSRRVRQFMLLLQLPGRAKSLATRYSLEERQLRYILRWRECQEITTLVAWMGKYYLSSREVLTWTALLKSKETVSRVFPGLKAARECLRIVRPNVDDAGLHTFGRRS